MNYTEYTIEVDNTADNDEYRRIIALIREDPDGANAIDKDGYFGDATSWDYEQQVSLASWIFPHTLITVYAQDSWGAEWVHFFQGGASYRDDIRRIYPEFDQAKLPSGKTVTCKSCKSYTFVTATASNCMHCGEPT